jgi:hypothetical protein
MDAWCLWAATMPWQCIAALLKAAAVQRRQLEVAPWSSRGQQRRESGEVWWRGMWCRGMVCQLDRVLYATSCIGDMDISHVYMCSPTTTMQPAVLHSMCLKQDKCVTDWRFGEVTWCLPAASAPRRGTPAAAGRTGPHSLGTSQRRQAASGTAAPSMNTPRTACNMMLLRWW